MQHGFDAPPTLARAPSRSRPPRARSWSRGGWTRAQARRRAKPQRPGRIHSRCWWFHPEHRCLHRCSRDLLQGLFLSLIGLLRCVQESLPVATPMLDLANSRLKVSNFLEAALIKAAPSNWKPFHRLWSNLSVKCSSKFFQISFSQPQRMHLQIWFF